LESGPSIPFPFFHLGLDNLFEFLLVYFLFLNGNCLLLVNIENRLKLLYIFPQPGKPCAFLNKHFYIEFLFSVKKKRKNNG